MEGGLLWDVLEELVESLWGDYGGIAEVFEFLAGVSTCIGRRDGVRVQP